IRPGGARSPGPAAKCPLRAAGPRFWACRPITTSDDVPLLERRKDGRGLDIAGLPDLARHAAEDALLGRAGPSAFGHGLTLHMTTISRAIVCYPNVASESFPGGSSMPVALVTGCSSGIGLATALHFAREKYDVRAGVRTPGTATELREAIERERLPVRIVALDVDDAA